MSRCDSEVDGRMRELEAELRESGLRMTVQRREVLREVAGNREHPDAETVYQRVQRRIPMISRDTVYRTLTLLEDRGLIGRVNVLSERARFDGRRGSHPHFVCIACGAVKDVSPEGVDWPAVPDGVRAEGDVRSVEVRFRGVCRECLAGGE